MLQGWQQDLCLRPATWTPDKSASEVIDKDSEKELVKTLDPGYRGLHPRLRGKDSTPNISTT